MARRIRKPIDELTAADFDAHPCWEYATDEEDDDAQDETTVRPLPLERLAGSTQQVFVQAVFFFPNGRVRQGMVTLNAGDDVSGRQPALFGDKGLISFYNGSSRPSASALKRFVGEMKKFSAVPFPIRYVSALHGADGQPLATGTLDGLYWLADWRTGDLRVESEAVPIKGPRS